MRRVLGLALAAEPIRNLRRQPAERLAVGVDQVPGLLDLVRFGGVGLHRLQDGKRTPCMRARPQRGTTANASKGTVTPEAAAVLNFPHPSCRPLGTAASRA